MQLALAVGGNKCVDLRQVKQWLSLQQRKKATRVLTDMLYIKIYVLSTQELSESDSSEATEDDVMETQPTPSAGPEEDTSGETTASFLLSRHVAHTNKYAHTHGDSHVSS